MNSMRNHFFKFQFSIIKRWTPHIFLNAQSIFFSGGWQRFGHLIEYFFYFVVVLGSYRFLPQSEPQAKQTKAGQGFANGVLVALRFTPLLRPPRRLLASRYAWSQCWSKPDAVTRVSLSRFQTRPHQHWAQAQDCPFHWYAHAMPILLPDSIAFSIDQANRQLIFNLLCRWIGEIRYISQGRGTDMHQATVARLCSPQYWHDLRAIGHLWALSLPIPNLPPSH